MEKIKIQGIDEEIYYAISNTGLPIYVWQNEFANSFYISLNVKYGSLDTEFKIKDKTYKVPNGIAHFMEHVKFNVDKDRTANDLFDPLGSDINAFTTFKYTSYLVYGTKEFDTNLNYLLDYVYNPYFTKDMIKKEKGIIASEINMGKDQVYNNLYYAFNEAIFHKEKFRNLVTGEVKDIKNITLEDLKLVYNAFYHPENMFLIVTGNVNPYAILDIVNNNLENKNIPKYLAPVKMNTKEPKTVYKKSVTKYANVEIAKGKIGLKLERKDFKYDDVTLNIILNILLAINFDDTSDFKESLLQEELITYLSYSHYLTKDYVIIDITLESKYLDEALKKVLEHLNNLVVSEKSLKRKVNLAISTLITGYEDVEVVNNILQNYLINYDKIITNSKESYESITIKDLEDVIKKIKTKECSIIKMIKEQ